MRNGTNSALGGRAVTSLNLGNSCRDYGYESPGESDHLHVCTEVSGESCASAWGQAKLGANIYPVCAGKCAESQDIRGNIGGSLLLGIAEPEQMTDARRRSFAHSRIMPMGLCADVVFGSVVGEQLANAVSGRGLPGPITHQLRGQDQAAQGKFPRHGREDREKGRQAGTRRLTSR